MTSLLVGNSTAQSGATISANYVCYTKYTAVASGVLKTINVYSKASGHFKAALYSDNAGEPGNRLSYNDSSIACTINQWNSVTMPDYDIVSGTVYWLAFIIDTMGAVADNVGGPAWRYKAATYSTFTWPASAGVGFTSSTRLLSINGYGTLLIAQVVGGGAVGMAGSLTKISTFVVSVGNGAVNMTGTLTKGLIYLVSVGNGAVGMAGTLSKTISHLFKQNVGQGSVAMVGSLVIEDFRIFRGYLRQVTFLVKSLKQVLSFRGKVAQGTYLKGRIHFSKRGQ